MQRAPPPRHPKAFNAPEQKVAGRNACRALFDNRRAAIRRAYVTEELIPFFADALKWCAQERIAYHVKTAADLDQIAETVHHDGVCFIARERPQPSLDDVVRREAGRARAVLVLLEDVKNPHNLGAILRVCAHFGVRAVLAAGDTPALSPAAMRTAEGGAEHVDVVPVGDGRAAVARLRAAGFRALATSSHTKTSIASAQLPDRALVLFGSEGAGLSQPLVDVADGTLAIPGSGLLESLNVACASSVILWELFKRGHSPASSPPENAPRSPPSTSPPRPPRPGRDGGRGRGRKRR